MENKVITSADTLIFVTKEARDLVMRKYPQVYLNKTRVIPHPYDRLLYKKIIIHDNKVFRLRYMGSFYGDRTPVPLLKALKHIKTTNPDINFSLEIYGSENNELNSWIENYDLKNDVFYCGKVTYVKSLELMSSADMLVLIDAEYNTNVFLPSKLIDYLGAKKPILAITPRNSPSFKMMKKTGMKSFEENETVKIANYILSIYGHHEKITSVNSSLLKIYSASHIAKEYERIFYEN
jgi:hypothetical protein